MNYEHIARLVRNESVEKLAINEMISELDEKVLKLYREYRIVKSFWKDDKDNDDLKEYLNAVYWKLINEVRTWKHLTNVWGHKDLSVVTLLPITFLHNN